MSELIRMKALRAWRNTDYEGTVLIGQEFNASFDRARELERAQLAVRIVARQPPHIELHSETTRPLQFGDLGGAPQPSSSPPARAQQAKTLRKFAVAQRL